jgi:DNA-binding HxlR family transcriptional regulator
MAYGQYCGVARALDLIGDRWTLLIVRELMSGRSRYQEIRAGLPGVATNLLAERLRRLEAHGLLRRDGIDYLLTPRGEGLRPVLRELIRWAEPLMVDGQEDDHFDGNWLIVPLEALLTPAGPGLVQIHSGGATIHVRSDKRHNVTVGSGPAVASDATLTADGEVVLGIASGHLRLPEVVGQGLATIEGDAETAAAVLRTSPRR